MIGLLVGVVVVFNEGDAADYVEGDGLGAGELEGGSHGDALPDGGERRLGSMGRPG